MPDAVAHSASLIDIIKMLLDLGPIGLIMVLWYFGRTQTDKILSVYQTDMQAVLKQYREDMVEQRRMYENNAELVNSYQKLASDLKEVIILVTQNITQLNESIKKDCK